LIKSATSRRKKSVTPKKNAIGSVLPEAKLATAWMPVAAASFYRLNRETNSKKKSQKETLTHKLKELFTALTTIDKIG